MERYRINELADETGVTPRTIRFYVAEGLLPPPEGNGPAAVYTAAHRDRLRLIGLLKAQYLPLREIRKRIAPLTDAEVRAQVREAEATAGQGEVAVDEVREPGSALAYLDRVLGRAAERPPTYATPPPATPPRPAPPLRRPAPAPGAGRERWERIVLADGVELHVREDRRREVGPLEALIRHARDLLGEK